MHPHRSMVAHLCAGRVVDLSSTQVGYLQTGVLNTTDDRRPNQVPLQYDLTRMIVLLLNDLSQIPQSQFQSSLPCRPLYSYQRYCTIRPKTLAWFFLGD